MCFRIFFSLFVCANFKKNLNLFLLGGLHSQKKFLLSKGKQVKIPASSHSKVGGFLFFSLGRGRGPSLCGDANSEPQDGDHTLGKSSLFFANTGRTD